MFNSRIHQWVVLTVMGISAGFSSLAIAETDPFEANALRGVRDVQVQVEGINADFARYGLTRDKLRSNVVQRLRDYGMVVLDGQAAIHNKAASQITIRLYANQDTYANFSCRVALILKRKLPLDATGEAFVSKVVWSHGRNGLLNPSDLTRIYGYVDSLLDQFLADHDRGNPSAQVALTVLSAKQLEL